MTFEEEINQKSPAEQRPGLTFSEDHLSWECSAYLLAMYSSFSGREMLWSQDKRSNIYQCLFIHNKYIYFFQFIPADAGGRWPRWRAEGTNLAVLMGLGSKLPCESTDACFSSIPSRLTSTKSGGRAPAMAHRHDLAILKSSASYFCRRDGSGKKKRGHGRVFPPLLFVSRGGKMEDGNLKNCAPSDELSQTDKWFIYQGPVRSRALHRALALLSVTTKTRPPSGEPDAADEEPRFWIAAE